MSRTDLAYPYKSELLAKLASSRERRGLSRGKEAGAKKPQAYPLGYVEDFFDFADADPGQRSTFAAEDNFASSSLARTLGTPKLALLSALLVFASCTQHVPVKPDPRRAHNFDVSVKFPEGGAVSFNDQLVHRVSIPSANLAWLIDRWGRNVGAPFTSQAVSSGSLGEEGFVVMEVDRSGPFLDLGLKPKDMITAVNKKKGASREEFMAMLSKVLSGERGSVTLLRGDVPHKILYSRQ